MGKEGAVSESMSEWLYVCFPKDWEKRATVGDAAVTWAGKRNVKKNGNGNER